MKRRKFLAKSAKAGLGLLALAQVGGATPALAQQAPTGARLRPFLYCPHRAVLLISMGRTDSRGQPKQTLDWYVAEDQKKLKKLLAGVVPGLRNQRGVHHVEPVVFQAWKDDVGKTDVPWRPNGALVFVQSSDRAKFIKNINLVYKAAKGLDQEMMVLEPLGDLDDM